MAPPGPPGHLDLHVFLGRSPDSDLLQARQPVFGEGHSVLHTAVLQEGGVGGAGGDAGIPSHDVAPSDPHRCVGGSKAVGRGRISSPTPVAAGAPAPSQKRS